MLKQLLILLLISCSAILKAQNTTEKELETIETPEQIKSYLETKNSKKNKLITFNEEKHKTRLTKELFKMHVGGTKISENEFEKTYYKIADKTKKIYYRVSYIYLDGTKYKLEKITNLRNLIINKFKNGASFDFLAKQYSMDDNANKGGDSGWFLKGDMHPDFENSIIKDSHEIHDIFTIDIPSKKWYYVILKTYEPKEISEIEVLKIIEQVN
ncbi:peptidylprolyl isomerase [Thalassobellus suaedae]|uniref:Peptidylprolyl isomerase n=1 Tax=Thalassobellus suaedae TaxID=3074124 RepID=A0ABY9XWC3_9FLAO|nr:peptidylprolyl isomerase [Flavobacteriaceae bacterium HL-DH14]